MGKNLKTLLAVVLSVCLVVCGMNYVPETKAAETLTNVATGRNGYAFMTSNANNGSEGFCYVGNGFSAINTFDENLTNGNNLLGTTATTDEVAAYVDLGASYDITSALVYQGSTNNNYYDSYCTNYSVYYSTEAVNATNQGNITWNLAGTCTNGTIYSGAKVNSAANVSDTGDSITFANTYTARSVKIVFDKNSCMGTGTNGAGTGTTGTVSLLSVRVYAVSDEPETTTVSGSSGVTTTAPASGTATDILFIGNSMTYYNELQDIFEAFGTMMGKNVNCTAATNGGKNLIYQSTASNVVTAIQKGGYEIVILQDVVSSFNASNLMTGAKAIIETIHQYNPGAQIVFYAPWPKEEVLLGNTSRLSEFTQGYVSAARATGGLLAPAGEAFYDVYVTEGYNYYADGLHPKPMGSFVSATSIYYAIYGNEALTTFTSADLANLNAVVNVAQSNKVDYTLDEFNNITAASYKYARAVAPAVADTTGNTTYTSALYTIEDPTLVVKADLSAYSEIDLSNSSVIDVSSSVNDTNTGDKIIDKNYNNRWESAYADPQYFTIALDKTYTINGMKIYWEGAASQKYVIQTSTDNANWTTVFEQKVGNGGNGYGDENRTSGLESIKFETVTKANYVRLYSTTRTTAYGISIFEARLFGSVASGQVTPPETTTAKPEESSEVDTTTAPADTGELEVISINTPNVESISGDSTARSVEFSWTKATNATKYTTFVGSEEDGVVAKAYHNNYAFEKVAQASVDHLKATAGTTVTYTVVGYDANNNVVAKGTVSVNIPELTDAEKAEAEKIAKISTNENLAKGKTAFVSSKTGTSIVDGNLNSNWQADPAENPNDDPSVEYFGVDLGSEQTVGTVIIAWENSYATAYDIYVAGADGIYGDTPVASGTASGNNPIVITEFDAVIAQYVQVVPTALSGNAKNYGTCVYELAVLAAAGGSEPTTPAVTTPEVTTPEVTTPEVTTPEPSSNEPSSEDDTTTVVVDEKPVAPVGLAVVTGYNIAWDGNEDAVSYNIYVEGNLADSVVATSFDATAYINEAGSYEVAVTAVSASGKESDPATITLTKEPEVVEPSTTVQEPSSDVEPDTTAPEPSSDVEPDTTTPEASSDVEPDTTTPEASSDIEPNTTTVAPTTVAPTTVAPTTETPTTVAPTTVAPVTTTIDPSLMKKPGKVTAKKAKKKLAAKKASITLKAVKGATGYEIAIYKSKKNAKKNIKAIVTVKVTSVKAVVKDKKLKNKKKLFVRIRAYVDVNGTKVHGKWSKVKKIKIK